MSCRAMTRWLFGKLPALGDFVARGLDRAAQDRLDTWLSEEMTVARERYGDAFADRYQTAPAWHFVDADLEGRWSGGALCASVDRAGRFFPLIVAQAAGTLASAAAVAAGCLDLIYAALHHGWTADQLATAPLVPAEVAWQPQSAAWALIGVDGPAVEIAGKFPPGVIARMMELAG